MTDKKRKEILLKAKPIRFDTEMVRAILDDRKTQARRVLNPQPEIFGGAYLYKGTICTKSGLKNYAPYQNSDILYVRETWAQIGDDVDSLIFDNPELLYDGQFIYRADFSDGFPECHWHPSVHMPRETARIFLRVTNVSVAKLQDIITDDCLTPSNIHKEGVREPCVLCIHPDFDCGDYIKNKTCDLVNKYIELWDSTIKKSDLYRYGWNANPWVWVIEFERID